MINFRTYGQPPYNVAVVHGGPGAPGDMAPVAKELSTTYSVLEPLQTKATLNGQIDELASMIKNNANPPITLIGHSWGAMLSFIVTAQNSSLVKKLILIGSGVFDEQYAAAITDVRLSRLSDDERKMFGTMLSQLNNPAVKDKNTIFEKFGKLMAKADSFDPQPHESDVVEYQYHMYNSVWPYARDMRASGQLLQLGMQIGCPVVAIHGDHDPHPTEGIRRPLSNVLSNFRFVSLQQCGHYPWHEKKAKNEFYSILRQELEL